MKILVNKNKYGIQAIANNKEKGKTLYISVWMNDENSKKIEEGKNYLLDVADGSMSCYEKKDGTLAPKIFIRKFVVAGEYLPKENKPVEEPKKDIPEPLKNFEPIDDDNLPF